MMAKKIEPALKPTTLVLASLTRRTTLSSRPESTRNSVGRSALNQRRHFCKLSKRSGLTKVDTKCGLSSTSI